MKDTIWVFQTFGFKTGMQFAFDSIFLKLQRLWNGQYIPPLESLSDEEVERLTEIYLPERQTKVVVHSYEDTVN